MSLINEALKKAKVDAARRDALESGRPYPIVSEAPASRPWLWALGGAGVAVLLVALGARLAAPSGDAMAGDAAVPPAVAPAATPVQPPAPTADQVTAPPAGGPQKAAPRRATAPTAAPPAAPRATTTPAVEPRPRAAEPSPGAPPSRWAEGQEVAPPPSQPVAPPDSPPTSSAAPPQVSVGDSPRNTTAEVRTAQPAEPPARAESAAAGRDTAAVNHLREAPLPGGGSLRLDGIAWSEVQPAAVLNGQIIGLGESISGFRVTAIERDRVTVEDDGLELVIRLK